MKVYRKPAEAEVKALLTQCRLPTDDITHRHLEHFLACGTPQKPDGVVGLEIYGAVALLRSLAVAKDRRGMGCGKALVAAAERYARSRGVRELCLLTTTAELFFERLGYRRCDRESAHEAIRRTREFSELCPSRAAFMVKQLPAAPPACR